MLNLYDLTSEPNKLKGSWDDVIEHHPELAWEKYKHNPEELKKREHLWIQSAEYVYWYARFVIKGRWLEGESVIVTNPHWARRYAEYIIEGRWPEAEPYIMKDPDSAFWYAKFVIKGCWPEAEPYIERDDWCNYQYTAMLLDGC